VTAGVAAIGIFGIEELQKLSEAMNEPMNQPLDMADPFQSIPAVALLVAVLYLAFFAIPFAFSHIFITRPIMLCKAEAMVIHDAQVLTQSRQREHDHAAEAGGFADALGVDVGAGF